MENECACNMREDIKETGEWWRAWYDLAETNRELRTSDFEAAVEELKAIFPPEWVRDNLSKHHFALNLCSPYIQGNREEMLSLGIAIHKLGGVGAIQNETKRGLKNIKGWFGALYEINVLSYMKTEGYAVQSNSQVPGIGKGFGKPDALVEVKGQKYWIEVKHLVFSEFMKDAEKKERELIKKIKGNFVSGEINLGLQFEIINEFVKRKNIKGLDEYVRKFAGSVEKVFRKKFEIAERIISENEPPFDVLEEGVHVKIERRMPESIKIVSGKPQSIRAVNIRDLDISSLATIEFLVRMKRVIKDSIEQIPKIEHHWPMILIVRPSFPPAFLLNNLKELTLEAFRLAEKEKEEVKRIKEIWLDSWVPEEGKQTTHDVIGQFIKIETSI
jgi:hypothetical protein